MRRLQVRVAEENEWLDRMVKQRVTSHHIEAVRGMLMQLRPGQMLMNHDEIVLDERDFSCLACERYVTGYCISVTIAKFVEEAREANHNSCLALPSTALLWASSAAADEDSLAQRLQLYTTTTEPQLLKQIPITVHIDRPRFRHWGLLCLDVSRKQLLYDDGLRSEPPDNLVDAARKILTGLHTIFQDEESLVCDNWEFNIKRFGMPLQPKRGEGSGSCGVGVILAARDIIRTGRSEMPRFSWTFEQMGEQRVELMCQIISWSQ